MDEGNLRDRIAKVLPSIFDRIADGDCVEWTEMADAVIRELDSHGWLIDPESEEREWLRDKSRWLKGEDE